MKSIQNIPTMWGHRSIAKLVNISPITNNYDLWYLQHLITIVTGDYKPTYNWGGTLHDSWTKIPFLWVTSPRNKPWKSHTISSPILMVPPSRFRPSSLYTTPLGCLANPPRHRPPYRPVQATDGRDGLWKPTWNCTKPFTIWLFNIAMDNPL